VLVRIRLSYEQIERNGKHKILLSETQKKKLDKSKKSKKGLELELSYEQMRINHSGGFLGAIFAGLTALGTLLGGGSTIENSVTDAKHKKAEEKEIERHNIEMEKIAKEKKC
jgi:hypothetical protein